MLYIALLKLRIGTKFQRNFNMIYVTQTHAYLSTRSMFAQRGSVRWRHLGLECAGAHALESGITLSERNPSSGRRLVPKGGVSLPAPFQAQTHTRWQLVEGRGPETVVALNCHLYIDIIYLSSVSDCDVLHQVLV